MAKNRRKPDHDQSAYVYRHIRHDTNQVFYIGIGIGYYGQRALQKTKRSEFWNNIVSKTTWHPEIMIDRLTRGEAEQKEIEFINLYKRTQDGGTLCNITLGGDGSFGLRGEESPNFGKKHSEERVRNMIAGLRKGITNETRKKLSEYAKNRQYSAETRKKIGDKSRLLKGRKRKPLTDDHKSKVSVALKKLYENRRINASS